MGKTKVFRGFFVFLRRKSPNGDGKQVADRSKGACIYLVATESWTYDDALRALWKRQKLAPRTMTVFRAIGALVQGGAKSLSSITGLVFLFCSFSRKIGIGFADWGKQLRIRRKFGLVGVCWPGFSSAGNRYGEMCLRHFFSFPLSNQVLWTLRPGSYNGNLLDENDVLWRLQFWESLFLAIVNKDSILTEVGKVWLGDTLNAFMLDENYYGVLFLFFIWH